MMTSCGDSTSNLYWFVIPAPRKTSLLLISESVRGEFTPPISTPENSWKFVFASFGTMHSVIDSNSERKSWKSIQKIPSYQRVINRPTKSLMAVGQPLSTESLRWALIFSSIMIIQFFFWIYGIPNRIRVTPAPIPLKKLFNSKQWPIKLYFAFTPRISKFHQFVFISIMAIVNTRKF